MAIANVEIVVDYAEPMIKLEKLLRKIHDKCLEKKYAEADELCLEGIAEMRVLSATLAIMESKGI